MPYIEAAVAAAVLGLLIGAWLIGKRLGRRTSGSVVEHSQFGVVQSAILALLGLLLGLCFAGAVSRFTDRQQILIQEASSIGTMNDMIGLLDADTQREARGLLLQYMKTRRSVVGVSVFADDGAARAELQKKQSQIWTVLANAVRTKPELILPITSAYSSFSNSLTLREAAEGIHIPIFVLVLLILSAVASIASIGMAVEISDRRLRVPASVLIFLIWATLWLILDLDLPRTGFIQLSPQPLDDAIAVLQTT